METKTVAFNRTMMACSDGPVFEEPSQKEVKSTPQLVNASLEDALRYGGDLAKQAIRHMNLGHRHKYIVVDTKVHMLMPGMSPAIPGWHTDGAPRGANNSPVGLGPPNVFAQDELNPPRYHILVTGGANSLTQFLNYPIDIPIPTAPTYSLYSYITEYVNSLLQTMPEAERSNYLKSLSANHVYEFDWWDIHRGRPATEKGWRYLIRVTETDYLEPWTDLRDILRTQIQVYVPETFGW